jgi:hypothetical protein
MRGARDAGYLYYVDPSGVEARIIGNNVEFMNRRGSLSIAEGKRKASFFAGDNLALGYFYHDIRRQPVPGDRRVSRHGVMIRICGRQRAAALSAKAVISPSGLTAILAPHCT